VYAAAADLGVPVVQTLHNYRFVCPVATLFRDGHVCRDCVGRSVPWPAVVHACIHDSHAQSAVAAATLAFHRATRTFDRAIACYVALTPFQRAEVIAGGLPADRVRVIPNFLEPDPGRRGGERTGVLFVGRLSTEKGIDVLVAAARSARGITRMAGAGPMAGLVERAHASGDLEYLGVLPSAAVHEELQRAVAMVLPSICFEGFPLTVAEAFACGTPIIASRIGSLEDLVEDGSTGLLTVPGQADDLSAKLRWAVEHPADMAAMGARARSRYEALYRGPSHLAALLDAYAFAASSAQADKLRKSS
jgi:glycosyltransferase involved in cell wall biosynthesis